MTSEKQRRDEKSKVIEGIFGSDAEVTVWDSTPGNTEEGPSARYEKAVVRFRTASGNVDVWVQEGRLRLSTVGNTGNDGAMLTVRPRGRATLEIVPGL
jgi:hypothetical protein